MKILFLALIILGLAACKEEVLATPTSATGIDRLAVVTPAGPKDFVVELALTPSEMQKGLMGRESMPSNAGMLFFFGDEAERGFYMKNTLIPLDMIFIRKNGLIHAIHEKAKPHDETTIYSKGPVAAVLELNGGAAAKYGLKPGQQVHHAFFGNSLAQKARID